MAFASSIDALLADPVARKELEKKLKEMSPRSYRVRAVSSLEDVVKQFRMLSKSTFKTLMNEAYDNVHRDDTPKPLPAYQQFVKVNFPIIREDDPAMSARDALKVISVMWDDFNAWNNTTPAPTTTDDNSNSNPGDDNSNSNSTAGESLAPDDFLDLDITTISTIPLPEEEEEEVDIVCASVNCKKGFTLAGAGLSEMPSNTRRWYCQTCVETNPRIGRPAKRNRNY